MAGFDLDFSQITDTNIENGDYEVVIGKVYEDATKGGAEYINFDMTIRNDINDQKFQNAHIFNRIFRSKETNKYPQGMLLQIAKASGLKDGMHYDSFDDFMKDMVGKPVKVRVRNEKSESNGNTYTNLNVKRWGETKFPNVQHQWAKGQAPAGSSNDVIDIEPDDLPF